MASPKLFKKQTPVTGKINRLYKLLVKKKGTFEQVACHITDNALRCTVLSLAQQNNQYAAELSSYMQSTGTAAYLIKKMDPVPETDQDNFPDENRVLAFCSSNEKKLVIAYRKIIAASSRYEGLQNMMDYQLNGILSACMQLKLLSSVNHLKKSNSLPPVHFS
jgi:hypothetical protein